MSEDNICEGNVDMTSYEYLPLIDLVGKGKFASLMSNTKIRRDVCASGENENNVAKTVDEEISQPTCTRRKNIQFLNEERVTLDTETTNLDLRGGPNCGILDLELGDRNLSSERICSHKTRDNGEPVHRVPEIANMCEKGMESISYHQQPESESMQNGSLDSQASYNRKICALKSNQDDESKDAESVHGEHQSNKCSHSMKSLKCKKPQKVRLLSDILKREISGVSCDISSSNGTVKSDDMDTIVADTEAGDDSDDLTLDTLFRSRKVVQGNSGKITECRKKRKKLQVEDFRPGQSRWSNSESDASWCRNSNKENNSIKSVIGSSASVSNAFSRYVALDNRAKKRHRKFSFQGRRSSSKTSLGNSCQELQLSNTDLESKETETGRGNLQFHFANDTPAVFNPFKSYVGESRDCDWKSTSCMKEVSSKGSSVLPHQFVPVKEGAGGKDVNVSPYAPTSNTVSDGPCHLKYKKETFKRKKGSSFPCNYEDTIAARAHSEVTENPSSELDALDGIPMEIVKLLAENRRERRLLDAETAYPDRISLTRSASGVENARKVQSTQAYDDVKSRDLWQNTFQVQTKSIRAEGGTCDETTCLSIADPPQRQDPHNVCFPSVVNNPIKIKGTQRSATSPPKQRRTVDVKIYSKKNKEKPCACVQKKIGKCPKLAAPLTMHGNESIPAMQLLRLVDAGMSSRTSHNTGVHGRSDAHKLLFPVDQGKHHTFQEPLVHIPLIGRNINSTQTGERRGWVSGYMVSDSVKSYKKAKIRSSCAAMQAMDSRVNGHVSGKNSLGTDYYQSFSFNNLKKGLSSASDSMILPVEPNMAKNVVIHAEVKKKAGVVWPVKGGYRSEICSVNRNPADFSIPGTGSKFMRSGRSECSRKGKANVTSRKM